MELIRKTNLTRYLDFFPSILICAFLLISLFSPEGNKFDMAKQIYLILFFGWISVFIGAYSIINSINTAHTSKRILISIIGFCGFFLISFFKSQTANFGFTELIFNLGGFILFLSFINLFKKKEIFEKNSVFLYFFLILLLFISSTWGYLEYFVSNHNRSFGFFYNPDIKSDAWPNAYALFFLMTWPILIHFATQCTSSPLNYFVKFVFIPLSFVSFYLSFSRAGFIAFGGQIFILFAYFLYNSLKNKNLLKTSKQTIITLILIVIFTLILTNLAQYGRSQFNENTISISSRLKFENGEEITSVRERLNFFKEAIELTKNEPIFGYGPMSFGFASRSIQKEWLSISDHPHNMFLKMSSELGLPATIFFILFLICIFAKFITKFTHLEGKNQLIALLLCVSLLGAIAHSLVDFNFNFATNIVIFFMLLAFFYYLLTNENKKSFNNKLEKVILTSLCVIVLILISLETINSGTAFLARNSWDQNNFKQAEKYFDIYGANTLFARYFYIDQANREIQIGNIKKAEELYKIHIEENKFDSFGYNKLGEFYLTFESNLEKAEANFKKAIDLDPKNFWIYYLNYVQTLKKENKNENIKLLSYDLIDDFEDYVPKAELNLHYTAQKGNATDAVNLIKILQEYDKENFIKLDLFKVRITKAVNKFMTK